jgi:hypothetical protein
MPLLLQETGMPGLVDAAGWVMLVGGLLFTALWLRYLYR